MVRIIGLLLILFFAACSSKSRDEIIDFQGVSPNEGIAYLNGIEKTSENNSNIYFKRASLFFQLEQYEKALLDVNRSLEIEENNADYVYLAGRVYQKINQPENAIENLLLAEGLGLHNHLLYQALAEEYLKIGKSEDARRAIERLIGLTKSSANYALAGRISLNLGDTLLAEKYYNQSIILDANAPSYRALSDIYKERSLFEQSGKYLNNALKIQPNNLSNLHQKAIILTKLDLLDSAVQFYKKLVEQDSEAIKYKLELAKVFFNQYKYDSALLISQNILNQDSGIVAARLLLARVKDKTSNYQEAIDAYNQILQQDSTFNLARVELENLQRKVAYLRRLGEQRRVQDSVRNNPPQPIIKKGINN